MPVKTIMTSHFDRVSWSGNKKVGIFFIRAFQFAWSIHHAKDQNDHGLILGLNTQYFNI